MTDVEALVQIRDRLAHLEGRVAMLEKRDAVAEVHRENVERRLAGIEGTLVKLLWLIVGSLIAAFMAFVINGGLSQVPGPL